jgi:long-chain acyl-CoA synthetase
MAENIASCFLRIAEKNRGGAVFRYFDGTWKTMTFGDLSSEVASLAGSISASGVSAGDRVAIFSENSPQWASAYLAVMFCGCVAVPMDTQLGPDEIRNILSDSGTVVVLCSARTCGKVIEAINGGPIKHIMLDSIEACNAAGAFKYLSGLQVDSSLEDTASLIYTSGTTGNPKGVILTHGNFLSDAEAVIGGGLVATTDNVLSVLPLHHTYGFMCNFMMPVAHGVTVTFAPGLKATDIVSAVKECGVTVIVAVPRIYEMLRNGIFTGLASPLQLRLVKLCGAVRRLTGINAGRILFHSVFENFRTLRECVSGGARLDPELMCGLEALGFTMVEGYGLTETSPIIAFNPYRKRKPGSVGTAPAGAEIKIEDGEIIVRGPMVMAGYYKNSRATSEVLHDGWFHTGDVGYMDEDGYVFITGRRKEIIVLGSGKNIYPDEIENAYKHIPLIREIAVVGVGSRGNVDYIQAIVVPDIEYAKERNIGNIAETVKWDINEVTARMPEYMRIRGFTLYNDPLPRTSLGKLRRFMLKDIIEASSGDKKTARQPDAALMADEAGRRIVECVCAVMNEQIVVRSEDNLELDLGFDSLAKIEFISALEAAFSVTIPDSFIGDVLTVGDALAKVMEITEGTGSDLALSLKWNNILEKELSGEDRNKAEFVYGPVERCFVKLMFGALRLFFRVYSRMSVSGAGNIPAKGPYILAANHASYLDGFAVAAALSFPMFEGIRFLGISKFFGGRLKRVLARLGHVIPIDSDRYLNSALQISAHVLRQGNALCIFPEGGRTFGEEMLPFKKGIGIIAVEKEIPVVPVYIDGAARALPRGAVFVRPARIRIVFGQPFNAADADMDKKPAGIDRHQFFADQLRQQLINLRQGLGES